MTPKKHRNGWRVLGLVFCIVALGGFIANHIWPRHDSYSTREFIMHVVLFVAGVGFIRPAILTTVSESLSRYRYGPK